MLLSGSRKKKKKLIVRKNTNKIKRKEGSRVILRFMESRLSRAMKNYLLRIPVSDIKISFMMMMRLSPDIQCKMYRLNGSTIKVQL